MSELRACKPGHVYESSQDSGHRVIFRPRTANQEKEYFATKTEDNRSTGKKLVKRVCTKRKNESH